MESTAFLSSEGWFLHSNITFCPPFKKKDWKNHWSSVSLCLIVCNKLWKRCRSWVSFGEFFPVDASGVFLDFQMPQEEPGKIARRRRQMKRRKYNIFLGFFPSPFCFFWVNGEKSIEKTLSGWKYNLIKVLIYDKEGVLESRNVCRGISARRPW